MTWPLLLSLSFFFYPPSPLPLSSFLDGVATKYFAELMLLLIPDDIGKKWRDTFRDILPGIYDRRRFLRKLTAYCGDHVLMQLPYLR